MTKSPAVALHGSWSSPISPQHLVEGSIRFGDLAADGDWLYWIESRPEEEGRCVIVRRSPQGEMEDVLPQPYSARTRVHEYGGGALLADHGRVFFSNFSDQRIYVIGTEGDVEPITIEGGFRYADFVSDPKRDRLIGVRERHPDNDAEVENEIVGIVHDPNHEDTILLTGSDFYASPRLSPGGTRLAWVSWHYPNMPWDGTELWVARLDSAGYPEEGVKIAGGGEESIQQPLWSEDGTLYFVSDRANWWNLYRWKNGAVESVCEKEAEFGRPQWVLGSTIYDFVTSDTILCSYTVGGVWFLGKLEREDPHLEVLNVPFTDFDSIRVAGKKAYCLAGSPEEPTSLIEIDPAVNSFSILRPSTPIQAMAGFTSLPETFEFSTGDNRVAYGLFYPPSNEGFEGPAGTLPPLIVMIHGGPTSATDSVFSLSVQFWTSRGFAVFDINYRGSSGYGREYRNLLNRNWGIADVEDCVMGARFLVDRGKVDGDKLIIRGGSAGGFTTLAALTFHDVFRAGASYYGVSDLEVLAKDTHKFESRYLDRLIGPYPESRDIYIERSPLHSLHRVSAPIIFLQGLEDRIVPPSQAEMMVEALKEMGVPVAYVPFAGEQHGFRKGENIIRAHEAELFFYSRIFAIPIADDAEPIEIFNFVPTPCE